MKKTAVKKHNKFSASSAERWVACPGSVELSTQAPPPIESPYAAEGTAAHTCLEIFLKNRTKLDEAERFLLQPNSLVIRPKEMVQHARDAAEFVLGLYKQIGGELLCETKTSLSFIAKDMGGTFDAAIVSPFDRLLVFDFKYGQGVAVEPEGNLQMIAYALGLAHEHDFNFDTVEMYIIQPRAEHPRGPIRSALVTIEELEKYAAKFKVAHNAATMPDAPLISGDHCRWCPAKPICPQISGRALQAAQADFAPTGEITLPVDWKSFTNEQIGRALTAFDQLEVWIEDVRKHAKDRADRGSPIPGWKLVEKRAIRKWSKPDIVEKLAYEKFGAEAFETNLISPAQFEKIIGKQGAEFVEKHAAAVSSGTTLVPESDKRPAVNQLEKDFPALLPEVLPQKQSRKDKTNGKEK